MRLVLSAQDGLNAIACDRLLALVDSPRLREAPEVIIDLQAAAYVEPYGALCLVLIGRHLVAQGQRLVCVLPGAARAQQALADMGVVQALRPVAELRNLPSIADSGYSWALPLTPIRARSDVQRVLEYLVELARRRLGFDAGDVLDATKIISELCFNVIDHSQAEGLATSQIFSDRRGQRFVSLAVVDAGQGIRASLMQRHAEAASWSDGEAIQAALTGLSSRQHGGGLGLRSVFDVVRRYQGRLAIRSGQDRLYVSAKRQPRVLAGAQFPGTQVGISFSQR